MLTSGFREVWPTGSEVGRNTGRRSPSQQRFEACWGGMLGFTELAGKGFEGLHGKNENEG